jgi:hypothetical protein
MVVVRVNYLFWIQQKKQRAEERLMVWHKNFASKNQSSDIVGDI